LQHKENSLFFLSTAGDGTIDGVSTLVVAVETASMTIMDDVSLLQQPPRQENEQGYEA